MILFGENCSYFLTMLGQELRTKTAVGGTLNECLPRNIERNPRDDALPRADRAVWEIQMAHSC